MIVFCEECGKKYRIDPAKIKGERARLKCKACGHLITVAKSGQVPEGAAVDKAPSVTGGRPTQPAIPGTKVAETVEAPPPPPPEEEAARPAEPPAPARRRRKFRFGLTAKVFILMLLVSLLPLGAMGMLAWQKASDDIRRNTEQLSAQIADGLADHVDEWIDKNLRVLQALSQMPEIVSMNRVRQEPLLKAVQEAYPWTYLVFTLDPQGMNVARNDGKPLKDYSDRRYYKDVMSGKAVAWQNLIGKTSKKPALVMAVPIKRGDRIVGVMANAMTIDDISKRIAFWRQGNTGYAFLVDESAKVVAHPNKAYTMQQRSLASHPLVAAARKRQAGVQYFTDANGKPSLGTTKSTRYGWILAVQQQEREAFQTLDDVRRFGFVLLACTVVGVLGIAWFFGRALTRPIKKLTDVTERISLGELDAEIDIPSKDEIGDLAHAIQRMSESIRLSIERLRRRR